MYELCFSEVSLYKCYCVGLQDSKIQLSCLPGLSFEEKKPANKGYFWSLLARLCV